MRRIPWLHVRLTSYTHSCAADNVQSVAKVEAMRWKTRSISQTSSRRQRGRASHRNSNTTRRRCCREAEARCRGQGRCLIRRTVQSRPLPGDRTSSLRTCRRGCSSMSGKRISSLRRSSNHSCPCFFQSSSLQPRGVWHTSTHAAGFLEAKAHRETGALMNSISLYLKPIVSSSNEAFSGIFEWSTGRQCLRQAFCLLVS